MTSTRADSGRPRRRAIALTVGVVCALLTAFPTGCGEVPTTTAPVADVYTLGIETPATEVVPGGSLQLKIHATDEEGKNVPDGTTVELRQDSSLANISPSTVRTTSGEATSTFTAGTQTGKIVVSAVCGKATVWVQITIDKNAKEPPPVNIDVDDIDVNEVTWLHPDPSGFDITATLSDIKIDGLTISWDWTHPSSWPQCGAEAGGVIGNNWVFARIDGRWYAATWEWLRDDTTKVTLEAKPGEPPFIQSEASPISGWYPQSGEEIGFMVSTCARGGIPAGSPRERSLIVKTTWP